MADTDTQQTDEAKLSDSNPSEPTPLGTERRPPTPPADAVVRDEGGDVVPHSPHDDALHKDANLRQLADLAQRLAAALGWRETEDARIRSADAAGRPIVTQEEAEQDQK